MPHADQRPSILTCARQMKHFFTNGLLKTWGSLADPSACNRVVLSQHWKWTATDHERVTDNPDKYQRRNVEVGTTEWEIWELNWNNT